MFTTTTFCTYLPGSSFAISAHRLPRVVCASSIARSSSSFQASLQMSGFKWLCHLSRHCFPILPGRFEAIKDHFLAPYFLTNSITLRSSSVVHGPLTSDGLRTFCHLCRHWTSVRFGSRIEMSFQFLAPCSSTAIRRASSYSGKRFSESAQYLHSSGMKLTKSKLTSSCVHLVPCFFPNDWEGFPVTVPTEGDGGSSFVAAPELVRLMLLFLLLILLLLLLLDKGWIGLGMLLLAFIGFCSGGGGGLE